MLALLHGYIQYYNPLVILGVLATVGYGFGVGMLLAILSKFARVRNTPLVFLAAVFFAVVAEYLDWGFWLFALFEADLRAFDPFVILGVGAEMWDKGYFSFKDLTPTGWVLGLLWVGEALIVMGLAIAIPVSGSLDRVFCEELGRWTSDKESVSLLEPIPRPAEFRQALEQGNFQELLRLRRIKHGAFHFTELEVDYCSGHDGLFVLTVKDVHVQMEKEKAVRKEENIVKHMYIDKALFERVKALRKNSFEGTSGWEEEAPAPSVT